MPKKYIRSLPFDSPKVNTLARKGSIIEDSIQNRKARDAAARQTRVPDPISSSLHFCRRLTEFRAPKSPKQAPRLVPFALLHGDAKPSWGRLHPCPWRSIASDGVVRLVGELRDQLISFAVALVGRGKHVLFLTLQTHESPASTMGNAPLEKAPLLEPELNERGKTDDETDAAPPRPARRPWRRFLRIFAAVTVLSLLFRPHLPHWRWPHPCHRQPRHSPFGRFPEKNDPFHFVPCTKDSVLPALDDPHPERTWAKTFDPNPAHWSWGNATEGHENDIEEPHRPHWPHNPHHHGKPEPGEPDEPGRPGRPGKPRHPRPPHHDPYAGRGIYLCGYIDVPLDYTNKSDTRISRLAVTKYQVSGLSLRGHKRHHGRSRHGAGTKSERTIVIEPGGPGGSGTSMAWRSSEDISKRLSGGKYDVLGWDPRGVNASLPAISCFPYDVDRDHWAVRMSQYRETSASPRAQLEFFDAMSDSVLRACKQIHGDIPRFVSTAFVARDLEQIRLALGEDALTGYLVSYGTGIGQTYANMFPSSVGRMILDGTEYVRDHRVLGGFGWTALDNGTNAFHDGLLGECVHAGPDHCALAKPVDGNAVTLDHLQKRMDSLIRSLIQRPLASYMASSGPSLVTYSSLVGLLYGAMYNARGWPALAQMLYELEAGNTTLAAAMLERSVWEYDPTKPPPPSRRPRSEELGTLVICADQYDAPEPEGGLAWYESLWANMTARSWIAGNSRFQNVFPCRHFTDYWPEPAEVYRGDLNSSLGNPVLLIAETYDPATPLRNGRRLLSEMGRNARLIAHHGYGHSSRDTSACTDGIAKAYILEGTLPEDQETACYADEKPYLYGVKKSGVGVQRDPLEIWDEHIKELAILNPRLLG